MTALTFNELHDKYRDRLLMSMRRCVRNEQDAEDITSAAFQAAFQHRDQYRGESDFYTWLYRIAINAYQRRRRRRTVELDAMDESEPDYPREPDLLLQTLDRSDCCARVRKALRLLPAIYRRTLVQRFLRGYSLNQMARCQRVPRGTIGSRIFKAKRLLRQAWAGPSARWLDRNTA